MAKSQPLSGKISDRMRGKNAPQAEVVYERNPEFDQSSSNTPHSGHKLGAQWSDIPWADMPNQR